MALYIIAALLGWVGGNYVYSQLPSGLKQRHPFWAAGLVGGIVGLLGPLLLSAVRGL